MSDTPENTPTETTSNPDVSDNMDAPTETAESPESSDQVMETAAEYVAAFEENVGQLANVIWTAIVSANKEGVFVNPTIFAGAQAEVSMRIIAAQARSTPESLERFKQAMGL